MYFLKRLAFLPPLLLVIAFLAFVLVRVAPGGPFDKERKPASPEIERALLARYHLDEPILKQFGRFLGGLAQGDFGASLKYRNHTVSDIIAQALPVSMELGALAFLFALGFGLPAGVIAAMGRGRWSDYSLSFLALLAVCVPGFVAGPLLVLLFAIHWQVFPVALWGGAMNAVLPTVSLGLYFAGKVARLTREGMLEVLQMDFITAARAKGLSET